MKYSNGSYVSWKNIPSISSKKSVSNNTRSNIVSLLLIELKNIKINTFKLIREKI